MTLKQHFNIPLRLKQIRTDFS